MGERNENLALPSIFVHTCKSFSHAVESYGMGPPAFLPSEGRFAADFHGL
jgi:hypothetical protein